MNLSIIVALDNNNSIGNNGQIPWRLPSDLQNFRKLTMNKAIIMGRKTWESLPNPPLDYRHNIIITRNPNLIEPSHMVTVVSSADAAIRQLSSFKESFVIGGGQIYEQFMPYVRTLYVTEVDGEFDADTFFPKIDTNIWSFVTMGDPVMADGDSHHFRFVKYTRKNT